MATTAPDLNTSTAHLEPLLGRDGPVATVVIPAPDPAEDLADRLRILGKDARSQLEEQGAPPEVVDRIDAALDERDPSDWEGGIAIVAHADGVEVRTMVDPGEMVVAYGPLPRLVPFVHDHFTHRPHIVAMCDRSGADIAVVVKGDVRAEIEVDGDDQHVQKVNQGGWSQARFQRHSEHTWDQNAQEIVDVLVETAERIDAAVIIATGDERAVGLVADHLPERWTDRFVTDDFEPTDEATEAEALERAATAVRDRAAEEVVGLLERFAEARGRDGSAADGVDEVLTALRRGAVGTLLVAEDVDDEVFRSDTDPMQLATDRTVLDDLGLEGVSPARLTDAAIAAAVAGGADVVIVPEHGPKSPNGPLGALLRY